MSTTNDLPIHVYHPRTLGTWSIEAQRLDLGEGYKPSLALLPDGELVLVSLDHTGDPAAGTYTESMPLRRSTDGGRTWTEPLSAADVIGREQWLSCSRNGTLFISSHLLEQDTNNRAGITHSYLHRSTDGGRTWARTRILLEGAARRQKKPRTPRAMSSNCPTAPCYSASASTIPTSPTCGARRTAARPGTPRSASTSALTTDAPTIIWMVSSARISPI